MKVITVCPRSSDQFNMHLQMANKMMEIHINSVSKLFFNPIYIFFSVLNPSNKANMYVALYTIYVSDSFFFERKSYYARPISHLNRFPICTYSLLCIILPDLKFSHKSKFVREIVLNWFIPS